jgi:predicted metal-binding protein
MRDDMESLVDKLERNLGCRKAIALISRNWDATSYWRFHKIMLTLKKQVGGGTIVLGSGGGCRLCRTCGIHLNEPCKHPGESMPSPESWGIDVYSTLLNLEIPIEIPPRRIFTRVGFIATSSQIQTLSSEDSVGRLIPRFRKKPLEEVLESISKQGINVLDVDRAENYYTGMSCDECRYRNIWLCDRSLFPEEILDGYIKNLKIVVVDIERKFAYNLTKIADEFHRAGYYDVLKFADNPCNLCKECNTFGCHKMKHKRGNKYGFKNAFRCIKYLGISFEKITKGNRGYIIYQDDLKQ